MKNSNLLYISLAIIFVISISLNFKQFSDLRVANSNIIAISDTLRTAKNKVGEEVKSKNLLILDIKDLKNINSDLSKEISKLSNKDKRNLVEINKLNITIDMLKDSIEILQPDGTVVVVNDSVSIYSYPLKRVDAFRDLQGNFKVESTRKPISSKFEFISDKIYADIVINKTKVDGNLVLSASSSNPYVKITNIEGSVIDLKAYNSYQKPKSFGIGLHVGYGLSTNNGVVFISPYVGFGLSYTFIRF